MVSFNQKAEAKLSFEKEDQKSIIALDSNIGIN